MATTMPRPDELALTEVAVGARSVALWHIKDLDAFLGRMMSEAPQVPDDDIPYYAWIWPAALALGTVVLEGPSLEGVRALELGCGVGVVGLCAALHGAHTTLTDLQPGALELARKNTHQLGLSSSVTVQALDWRSPDAPLQDLLLASDVLYESRFAAPLAHAIQKLLAPGGVALVADPSRPHFERFMEEAAQRGLTVAAGPEVIRDNANVTLHAVWHNRALNRRLAPWERAT
jgi:predicted nicotinamide N-methyase